MLDDLQCGPYPTSISRHVREIKDDQGVVVFRLGREADRVATATRGHRGGIGAKHDGLVVFRTQQAELLSLFPTDVVDISMSRVIILDETVSAEKARENDGHTVPKSNMFRNLSGL